MKCSVTTVRIIIAIAIVSVYIICGSGTAPAVRQIHPPINLPVVGPPAYVVEEKPVSQWQSGDIIEAFKNSRLEVVEIESGVFVGAPGAKETTIFLIPSFGIDIGSLVSSFDSVENINEAAKYYSKMNDYAESTVWWIFKKENILVLISGKVPKERAGEYGKVLKGLAKE